MRILLAEDDPHISVIMQLVLERIGGHQVLVCEDGEAALQAAKNEHYDLVLLDGMMPIGGEIAELNGFERPDVVLHRREVVYVHRGCLEVILDVRAHVRCLRSGSEHGCCAHAPSCRPA